MSEEHRRLERERGDRAILALKSSPAPTIQQVNDLVHTLEGLSWNLLADYREELCYAADRDEWEAEHMENMTLWKGTYESLYEGPDNGELVLSDKARATLLYLSVMGDEGISAESQVWVDEIAQSALAWTVEQWTNATSQ